MGDHLRAGRENHWAAAELRDRTILDIVHRRRAYHAHRSRPGAGGGALPTVPALLWGRIPQSVTQRCIGRLEARSRRQASARRRRTILRARLACDHGERRREHDGPRQRSHYPRVLGHAASVDQPASRCAIEPEYLVHGKVSSIVVGGLVTATIDGLAFPFNFLPAIRGASADLESRTGV
jgi:hypothetical protein